ncbi:gamma-glutamylcyclotransferase-like [Polistes fuscatus]|uniref:gamma-glutamylcyclotransferase-like n=1 Tax=Polistes fuscatus TaxID=30207 RepID=UPI001CA8A99C|nr:gamma-glutamylcyclotransferase-like [Polistes fuscatus]
MASTFLYFAYGSNLLTKRIHFNNPTAVRKDIGRLKNYRLDFITYSKRWGGAAATIVPTENSSVWGAIWELDQCNLSTLDCQEGVMDNIYFPLTVDVETPSGDVLKCRVYQQTIVPANYIKPMCLPIERLPSPLYLETIIKGAQESQLPDSYIQFLKMISHNGFNGKCELSLSLKET